LISLDENGIFNVAEFTGVDTGGVRNETPLMEEQVAQITDYAVSLGMPVEKIGYNDFILTGYWPGYDWLTIGTDVLPGERTKNPNGNISWRGAIAHEIVGHREARLKGFDQPDELLEEVQASIRAARFAPDLSCLERVDLLRDAIYRLRIRGIKLCSVKHKLHIDKR
jgi:hypothetical protein